MSVKIPKCNIDHLKSAYELVEKHKKKYDPAERNDILKRALQFESRMRAASRTYGTLEGMAQANKIENRLFMDNLLNQKLGRINELNPTNRYKVQNFLENWLGIQLSKLGSGGQLSDVGAVRQRLLEARRLGSNYIDLLVDFVRNDSISALQKTVYDIGKRHGLSKREMQKILIYAREVGAIAQTKAARNIHEAGYAFLQEKLTDFIEDLASRGFSPDEIDDIMGAAHRIYARMDAVRATAQAMGVDVGNIEGIGYLPRMFQPGASKFVKAQMRADKAQAIVEDLLKKPNPLALDYHFQKSRSTFNFIPEDEVIVSGLIGVPIEKMREMIKDGSLAEFLHKNVSAETIDDLVDTGLMSKVPMFTEDMAEYVMSQYGDLPFKELDELLITDPERMYSAYKDALQRAAADSVMMKTIVEDGVGHGWAATEDMVKQAPDTFKGWMRWGEDEIKKYYDAWGGKDIWVHPDVDSTFKAIDAINQSPEKLSTLANIFRNIGGIWIQSALLSTGYVLRNLWTNAVSMLASGGNLLRVWEGFSDTSRVLKYGLEVLDDTEAVYKMGDKLVTKRKLFEEFFLHAGNNFVPQSSFLKAKQYSITNPMEAVTEALKGTKRGLGYLINYSKAYGFVTPQKANTPYFEGLTYLLEQLKQTQDVPMSYLARFSQFNENSMKWATIVSRADTRVGNRIGQFLSATKGVARDDWMQELREVDNLFFMWDDVGRIPAFTSRYLVPFSNVMMKIPPAVVRHAMTNPRKFLNYWRVRSIINQNAEEDPDYIDAGVADWKRDAGLLNLWKDPESGNWVGIMTNSFDPISGAMSFFEKTTRGLAAANGIYSGSTETQTRYVQGGYDYKDFIVDFLRDAPPINKAVIEFLTDVDLRTGRQKEQDFIKGTPTFLGVRMNPLVKNLLSSYPPLSALDRFNPGGVFGIPEVPDPKNPWEPRVKPKDSVFGAQRTEGSLERYMPEMKSVQALALNYLGIPTTVVDQAKQTQSNMQFMNSALTEVRKDIKKWSNQYYLGKITDKSEAENIYRQIKFAREVELKLDISMLRLKLWMEARGIPEKDLWNKAATLGISDLPPLGQEDADRMAAEYAKQLADLDARYNVLMKQFGE